MIDLRRLLKENLSFLDSKADLGLELVDILTNAIARAMNGRLQYNGWCDLGRLMVGKERNIARPFLFRAQRASRDRVITIPDPYHGVFERLNMTRKEMLSAASLGE